MDVKEKDAAMGTDDVRIQKKQQDAKDVRAHVATSAQEELSSLATTTTAAASATAAATNQQQQRQQESSSQEFLAAAAAAAQEQRVIDGSDFFSTCLAVQDPFVIFGQLKTEEEEVEEGQVHPQTPLPPSAAPAPTDKDDKGIPDKNQEGVTTTPAETDLKAVTDKDDDKAPTKKDLKAVTDKNDDNAVVDKNKKAEESDPSHQPKVAKEVPKAETVALPAPTSRTSAPEKVEKTVTFLEETQYDDDDTEMSPTTRSASRASRRKEEEEAEAAARAARQLLEDNTTSDNKEDEPAVPLEISTEPTATEPSLNTASEGRRKQARPQKRPRVSAAKALDLGEETTVDDEESRRHVGEEDEHDDDEEEDASLELQPATTDIGEIPAAATAAAAAQLSSEQQQQEQPAAKKRHRRPSLSLLGQRTGRRHGVRSVGREFEKLKATTTAEPKKRKEVAAAPADQEQAPPQRRRRRLLEAEAAAQAARRTSSKLRRRRRIEDVDDDDDDDYSFQEEDDEEVAFAAATEETNRRRRSSRAAAQTATVALQYLKNGGTLTTPTPPHSTRASSRAAAAAAAAASVAEAAEDETPQKSQSNKRGRSASSVAAAAARAEEEAGAGLVKKKKKKRRKKQEIEETVPPTPPQLQPEEQEEKVDTPKETTVAVEEESAGSWLKRLLNRRRPRSHPNSADDRASVGDVAVEATRLVTETLAFFPYPWPGSKTHVQLVSASLMQFAQTVIVLALEAEMADQSEVASGNQAASVIFGTFLLLRQVMVQNASSIFGTDVMDDSNQEDSDERDEEEEQRQHEAALFSASTLATSILVCTLERLDQRSAASGEDDMSTQFLSLVDSYEDGNDEFATRLRPMTIDEDDVALVGAGQNMDVDERVEWRNSYNLRVETHPVRLKGRLREAGIAVPHGPMVAAPSNVLVASLPTAAAEEPEEETKAAGAPAPEQQSEPTMETGASVDAVPEATARDLKKGADGAPAETEIAESDVPSDSTAARKQATEIPGPAVSAETKKATSVHETEATEAKAATEITDATRAAVSAGGKQSHADAV